MGVPYKRPADRSRDDLQARSWRSAALAVATGGLGHRDLLPVDGFDEIGVSDEQHQRPPQVRWSVSELHGFRSELRLDSKSLVLRVTSVSP